MDAVDHNVRVDTWGLRRCTKQVVRLQLHHYEGQLAFSVTTNAVLSCNQSNVIAVVPTRCHVRVCTSYRDPLTAPPSAAARVHHASHTWVHDCG
jgi:hypothetical protein